MWWGMAAAATIDPWRLGWFHLAPDDVRVPMSSPTLRFEQRLIFAVVEGAAFVKATMRHYRDVMQRPPTSHERPRRSRRFIIVGRILGNESVEPYTSASGNRRH